MKKISLFILSLIMTIGIFTIPSYAQVTEYKGETMIPYYYDDESDVIYFDWTLYGQTPEEAFYYFFLDLYTNQESFDTGKHAVLNLADWLVSRGGRPFYVKYSSSSLQVIFQNVTSNPSSLYIYSDNIAWNDQSFYWNSFDYSVVDNNLVISEGLWESLRVSGTPLDSIGFAGSNVDMVDKDTGELVFKKKTLTITLFSNAVLPILWDNVRVIVPLSVMIMCLVILIPILTKRVLLRNC